MDRVGTRETKQYFSIADDVLSMRRPRRPPRNDEDRQLGVREALLDSVRHHLVADVPVGAFLSSGIDSGALVGLMRDAGQQDIQTVTLAFEEFRGSSEDEAPIAAEIAAQYGTRHTTRFVTEQEFRDDLPKILEAMDQPTIDGLNTWFVSKAARELGLKVAISGLGGDELFGGYPSFRDVPLCVRALAIPGRIPGLGDLARRLVTGSWSRSAQLVNPKAAGLLKYGGTYAGAYLLRRGLFMPWELEAVLGADTARRGLRRLNPLRHIEARIETAADDQLSARSPCLSRRSTCAISCCATPTGPAWPILWKCGFRWSMSNCCAIWHWPPRKTARYPSECSRAVRACRFLPK